MSERLNFEFFCPAGKEDRAVELLETLDCVSGIGFNVSPVKKAIIDTEKGEISWVEGFGLVGQALPSCVEEILRVLSAEQIAGYSRDSMVLFSDPNEQHGEQ